MLIRYICYFLLLFVCDVTAESYKFPAEINRIIHHDNQFNGVVLVARGDKIIYEKAAGEFKNPKISSQFIIGSISKQITATLVLKLVDDGKIKLDKPIGYYLPELGYKWASKVTIKQLLNHTSGIISAEDPLITKPGSSFRYNNYNYDLLARLIAHMTKRSYKQNVELLFAKFQMTSSFVPDSLETSELESYSSDFVAGRLTQNHKSVLKIEALIPAGGLASTTHDLLKWNLALHGKKILKPTTYNEMMKPSIKRMNHRWQDLWYGYGVQISKDVTRAQAVLEISHNGIVNGYTSTLIFYPEHKVSLIILENQSFWPSEWNGEKVKKAFFIHDEIRGYIAAFCNILANKP
jgi:D-alanyl-D-alanine carboxypeptidase